MCFVGILVFRFNYIGSLVFVVVTQVYMHVAPAYLKNYDYRSGAKDQHPNNRTYDGIEFA